MLLIRDKSPGAPEAIKSAEAIPATGSHQEPTLLGISWRAGIARGITDFHLQRDGHGALLGQVDRNSPPDSEANFRGHNSRNSRPDRCEPRRPALASLVNE